MTDIERFKKIINGSKSFRMENTILIITSYYTGESIAIDLESINEEMLKDLIV